MRFDSNGKILRSFCSISRRSFSNTSIRDELNVNNGANLAIHSRHRVSSSSSSSSEEKEKSRETQKCKMKTRPQRRSGNTRKFVFEYHEISAGGEGRPPPPRIRSIESLGFFCLPPLPSPFLSYDVMGDAIDVSSVSVFFLVCVSESFGVSAALSIHAIRTQRSSTLDDYSLRGCDAEQESSERSRRRDGLSRNNDECRRGRERDRERER